MPSEFAMTRMVEFCETDLAGIMHFSNFFRHMEQCEHAFVRSIGFSIAPKTEPPAGWPRVKATCEYLRPLRFEDRVEIRLRVASRSEKALIYEFEFRKAGESECCAKGAMTVVYCVFREGRPRATFIPPEFLAALDA